MRQLPVSWLAKGLLLTLDELMTGVWRVWWRSFVVGLALGEDVNWREG